MTRHGSKDPQQTAPVAPPVPRRASVDYALVRRATLMGLRTGSVRRDEACDAQPQLREAALHLGEPARGRCPVCDGPDLRLTRWLYGEELGTSSGCCAYPGEEAQVAHEYAQVRVWVVEVCLGCRWNHVVESYLVGHGGEPARRQRRRARA